jgi:class 3 adenylate cyclase
MSIIRFPTERRIQSAARGAADPGSATQAAPAAEPLPAGQPFAFLSAEIRRLPRMESRIDGEVAGRILNRCVLACLEILSKERVPVDLSGTVLRPVVEATFRGSEGTARAAGAAVAMRQAVVKVQREVELEFHLFGAITAGSVSESGAGVTYTTGAPEQVAGRLREHAAPGQFLLSESARRTCEEVVAVDAAPIAVTMPGSEPVPAYPLVDTT